MKMLYQRQGGPILSWASGYPPPQSRAGETKSLGEYVTGMGDYVPNHPLPGSPEMISGITDTLANVQGIAGAALGAYHGYKRTGSIGWAIVWSAAGSFAPLITGAVAVAQGFGKPKVKTNPSRRRRYRRNPANLTKKGKRMYQAVKRGYEHVGETKAKEIAARTVYSAAKSGSKGLVKK